jgi:RimJ/RimL family protein N-acetyltransferase
MNENEKSLLLQVLVQLDPIKSFHMDLDIDLRRDLNGPRLKLVNTSVELLSTLYDDLDHNTFTWLPYQPLSKQEYVDFMTDKKLWILLLEGKPIGTVGYLAIVPLHHRLEIGHIILAPKYQGKQYGLECALLLILYAMNMNQYRIEWKTHHLNIASQKLALKLGFTFEGIFRNHMYYKGMHRNSYYYSIIPEEYDSVRAKAVERLQGFGTWNLDQLFEQ